MHEIEPFCPLLCQGIYNINAKYRQSMRDFPQGNASG